MNEIEVEIKVAKIEGFIGHAFVSPNGHWYLIMPSTIESEHAEIIYQLDPHDGLPKSVTAWKNGGPSMWEIDRIDTYSDEWKHINSRMEELNVAGKYTEEQCLYQAVYEHIRGKI